MILEILLETIKLVFIVFILMIGVEFLQLKYHKQIKKKLTKKLRNQIIGSSFLGAIPGCLDCFFVVSLYQRGLVGFGALTAVLLSTAGDEAFVMLAMIPKTAILIFAILIVLGIVGGFLAEFLFKKFKIKKAKPCCPEKPHHEKKINFKHFWKEHIIEHLVKEHIPKLFLWIFFTLLIVQWLLQQFDLTTFALENTLLLIIIAAVVGIIPESGPHLIFLTLYAQGLIPFSVLLVNTLSQDGHGLLPLLSYSVKDAVKVQIFTTLFALATGLILIAFGL